MSTLTGNKIKDTYDALIKLSDNGNLTATLKELSDGLGNNAGVFLNTAGDFKSTGILEFANLKDTGENVVISKFVDEADGIANNDNDTSLPTSAAVKDYVDTHVTSQDLDFQGDSGTGAVDLDSQILDIAGTTNEITTLALNQKLTIGLPNSVTISGTFTGATFSGDLNGTINTATTAITQTAGNNSTKVATTAYVDTLDAASDLDFSGDSGTGDVNLNAQTFAVTGTANQIVTTANAQGLSFAFPTTITIPNNSIATTQTAGDNSTKVATTAYVDTLDAASDLDLIGDSGTGDVNLNTQSFTLAGTTNQIITAVSGQTATLSLPATVHRNLQGNVTGDLTGNADTATKWQTARNLSISGEATGTIASVDGSVAVSGAVTLTNSAVVAKVLTGLGTPAAGNIVASDTILEAFGKVQSQLNTSKNGLVFKGTWSAATNTPTLVSGGGETNNGTTTSTVTNKLVDTNASPSFVNALVGHKVINQVDGTTALVTNVDSSTSLTLDADIMLTGEAYTIDNTPFINQGEYYVVNVGGTTNLNGISEWAVGDWVIAGGTNVWEKLDHSQVDGSGTPGNLTKWDTVNTLIDSIVAESGTALTITGSATTTLGLSSTGNFAVNTNKFTVNATSGNVAFPGDLAINTNKFTVNATSGNTLVAGTSTVSGNFTVNGTQSTFNPDANSQLIIKNAGTDAIAVLAGTGDSLYLGGNNTHSLILDTIGDADFSGTITAPNIDITNTSIFRDTVQITKAQETNQFDTSSFLRLHPSAVTNTSGYTNMFFGTSDVNNYGVAIGGLRAGTDGTPSFRIRMHNDSVSGTEVLTIDNSGNSNFAGGITGTSATFTGNVTLDNILLTPATLPAINTPSISLRSTNNEIYFQSGSANIFNFMKADYTTMLNLDGTNSATFAANVDIYKTTDSQLQIESLNEDATIIINSGADGVGGANREEGFIRFYQDNADHFTLGKRNNGQFVLLDHVSGTDVITVQDNGGILFTPANLLMQLTGSLGIGVVASRKLHIGSAGDSNFRMENTNTAIVSGENYGQIEWEGNDINTSANGVRATIQVKAYGAGTQGETAMYFRTSYVGADSNIERVRIDHLGNTTFTGDIMPNAENLFDIGSAATRWEDIYGDQVYGRSVYVDDFIYHSGETTNNIGFTTGNFNVNMGGNNIINIDAANTYLNNNNVLVNNNGGSLVIDGTGASELRMAGPSGYYSFMMSTQVRKANALTWSTLGTDGSPVNDAVGADLMTLTYTGFLGLGTISPTSPSGAAGPVLDLSGSNPEIVFHDTNGTANNVGIYYLNDQMNWFSGSSSLQAMILSTSTGDLTIAGTLTENSDITLKENIKPLVSQLEIVNKLNPVSYNKIGQKQNEIGFIAQEVEEFLPQLVREDDDGLKSLAYGNMNAVLVKAIQELTAKVEMLEKNCNCK